MKIKEILITEEEIKRKVRQLAQEINTNYADKDPLIIAVLDGSFIFCADLIKYLDFPVEVEFLKASSYNGETVPLEKVMIEDFSISVKDRDIILLDDILDSGNTLKTIKERLEALGAKSVITMVLVDKPSRRKYDQNADLVGFEIGNKFIVGYGMDYANRGRNLPYIAVIDEEDKDT